MFNVFKAIKYPSNNDECYYIDIVDKVTTETFEETPTLPLDACIIHSATNTEENFERRESANYFKATTPMPKYGKHQIEVLRTSIHLLPHPYKKHQSSSSKSCQHISGMCI